MKNKIFQFFWYYIICPCIPIPSKKKVLNPVIRHGREIYVQVRFARLLGNIAGFLAGDSNSAVFSTFMVMQRFSGLTLCIGQGGATAADWLDFFITPRGRYVYNEMTKNGVVVVWNIGGNYVLMGIVDLADMGMHHLKNIFQRAWFCTIPPLYYNVLDAITKLAGIEGRDPEYYRSGVKTVNAIISEMAKPRVIDLHWMFVSSSGQPKAGALMDIAHFRRVSVNQIRKVIGGVI